LQGNNAVAFAAFSAGVSTFVECLIIFNIHIDSTIYHFQANP